MMKEDKSVREFGKYTIVKTQDDDISIIDNEKGVVKYEKD